MNLFIHLLCFNASVVTVVCSPQHGYVLRLSVQEILAFEFTGETQTLNMLHLSRLIGIGI